MADEKPELIDVPNARLIESSFSIMDVPADSMISNVDVSLVDRGVRPGDGTDVAWATTSMRVRIVNAEDESDVRLSATAVVRAEVACRGGADREGGYLSCISECISLAKSHIQLTTSLSPMGLLMIPEVSPRAVLDSTATGER